MGAIRPGGGASLPTTPDDVLLDFANRGKAIILDQTTGEGLALSVATLLEGATGEATESAASGDWLVGDGTGGAQLASAAPGDVRAVLGIASTSWGTTTVDPLSGTGWTTTPASGVTVTWSAGASLTLAAAAGTTGIGFVTRDATPLGASSTSWEIAVRLDVTAGDGMGAPRGFFLMGFYVNASNYSLSTLRSDRKVGMFTNVAGSTTNVGETTGPSSGDLTGGQFWLRHSRAQNGQFISWWGVGTGGALPTAWRQLYTVTNTSLMTALPTTTTIYVGSGAYGEGAIGSPWTVEVLAIRMTSVGSL